MTDKKTIFRVACRHKPYSQLGNAMLRDSGISIEARGTLAFILSHPQDWKFSLDWLSRHTGMGRDKTQRVVRELIATGYCVRQRQRDDMGRLGVVEYMFSDESGGLQPQPENPVMDTQDVVSPQPEKPQLAKPATENQAVAIYIDNKKGQSQRNKNNKEGPPSDLKCASRTDKCRFSVAVLQTLSRLGLDVEALVERYEARTAGKRIGDPDAYLLRMGHEEAAKKHGVTVAEIKGTLSNSVGQRVAAAVSATRAKPAANAALNNLLETANARLRARGKVGASSVGGPEE